ncbi:Acetyltransferase (GNAT) family protein [Formivibrio citricus]|uniref:Acetyltransferase (GNAT) family protein n=1 Tax=Formivibrio citricus TaxID=83765 RepID=A0A1I5DF25_9NEIS|nr:GNAT family N-acetyltransferase [Formivibrio citricus]SFN97859.1 Acetyltransferase (GNAT) family protein [Formivibrio citricus]
MKQIIRADLQNAIHQQGLIACLDAYARDPMGGGEPLAEDAKLRLINGLLRQPANVNFLAQHGTDIVGAAVCFMGYSTFRARPRLNIHDLCVLPTHRGQGLGRLLLQSVADYAREQDCCAVSLEVRTDNRTAQTLYRSQGFGHLDSPMEFWVKPLC